MVFSLQEDKSMWDGATTSWQNEFCEALYSQITINLW